MTAALALLDRGVALTSHVSTYITLLALAAVVLILILVCGAVFAKTDQPSNRLVAILGALPPVIRELRPFGGRRDCLESHRPREQPKRLRRRK